MESAVTLVSFVTRAENRIAVLRLLTEGPRTRRALQDETGIPRATLSRILADFRERDLVMREGHEYALTPLGDVLATDLDSLFESVAGMEILERVRDLLAIDEFEVPVERLADAEVIVPEPTDPLAPIRRAETLLADASRVRLVGRSVVPGCLEAMWRAVTDGRQTVEAVVTPEALETAVDDPEMARQFRDLLATQDATLAVHEGEVRPALVVVDDVVFFAVADDAGAIQGHVETTDDTVLAWAEETIDGYVAEAEPVSPDVLTA